MSDESSNTNEDHFPDTELAELWKRQETPMAHAADPRELTELVALIKNTHRSEQVRLLWLNVREIVGIIVLTVFYGYWAVTEESGALLYISSLLCLGAGLFLSGSTVRQHRIEQHFDSTVRGSIERSLSQAQHRFWMFRNIGWWYFGPLAAAAGIFYGWVASQDSNGANVGDAVVVGLIAAFFAGLSWWNRRIAFTKWQPEVERYKALLADLHQS